MSTSNWQLLKPVSAVVFDCDGTLSTLEGIDFLAEHSGVGEVVKSLTAEAMGKTGLTLKLYEQRLALVKPRQEQVMHLGQEYFNHRVPDVDKVISLLQRHHKSIYLVSAGLYPAVQKFGNLLKIPTENIFAVKIEFDAQGNFSHFENNSALVENDGKRSIVKQLLKQHPHIAYVGDGLNDLSTKNLVTRFVGYGGIFYRENIASECQYYIKTPSLSALVPLVLTAEEGNKCSAEDRLVYQKGMRAIEMGEVNFDL